MDVEEHVLTQHSFVEHHNKDTSSVLLLLVVHLTEANLKPCHVYRIGTHIASSKNVSTYLVVLVLMIG